MNQPPKVIDGARVIAWAWSGTTPFGVLKDQNGASAVAIFGFAICQYEGQTEFYRFSCDKAWSSQQDSEYASVDEAKENIPPQYNSVRPTWVHSG